MIHTAASLNALSKSKTSTVVFIFSEIYVFSWQGSSLGRSRRAQVAQYRNKMLSLTWIVFHSVAIVGQVYFTFRDVGDLENKIPKFNFQPASVASDLPGAYKHLQPAVAWVRRRSTARCVTSIREESKKMTATVPPKKTSVYIHSLSSTCRRPWRQ